jgi:hypothetical protein
MSRTVKLYLHSPIRLHGVVLNELSTGPTLPYIGISLGIIALTHVIWTALHCTSRKLAATLNMEVVCSSKTSISSWTTYTAKQRGGHALHRERCGNFKWYSVSSFYRAQFPSICPAVKWKARSEKGTCQSYKPSHVDGMMWILRQLFKSSALVTVQQGPLMLKKAYRRIVSRGIQKMRAHPYALM